MTEPQRKLWIAEALAMEYHFKRTAEFLKGGLALSDDVLERILVAISRLAEWAMEVRHIEEKERTKDE